MVPPNANRDPVLLNHVVLDHRRVRFRGKKQFFFLYAEHFSSRSRKIQSLCKPGAGKRAGLTRSLVLSLSLLRAGHLPVLGLLQLQPGLQRIPILASGHQLFLLRRFGFRFHFPHVFPGEILPNARRRHVSRQIRGFFLDAPLRGVAVNDDCPVRKRAISGLQFNLHDGVRLGTEKRKREHVLSRIVFVHGAVLALGVVGV